MAAKALADQCNVGKEAAWPPAAGCLSQLRGSLAFFVAGGASLRLAGLAPSPQPVPPRRVSRELHAGLDRLHAQLQRPRTGVRRPIAPICCLSTAVEAASSLAGNNGGICSCCMRVRVGGLTGSVLQCGTLHMGYTAWTGRLLPSNLISGILARHLAVAALLYAGTVGGKADAAARGQNFMLLVLQLRQRRRHGERVQLPASVEKSGHELHHRSACVVAHRVEPMPAP